MPNSMQIELTTRGHNSINNVTGEKHLWNI